MVKIPERTCVICRAKKPQKALFRFLVADHKVIFDKEQKGLGRGFYVCSAKCWDSAVAKKRKIRIGSDARSAVNVNLPQMKFEEIAGRC